MKINSAKQIFDFLPGVWKIVRNVVSKAPMENIHADGYAAFIVAKNDPHYILYSEKVIIHHIDLDIKSIGTRKYEYKYDERTLSLSKYFDDGRLFYTLGISDHKIMGKHLCVLDKYIPTYTFSDDRFILTYSVDGPSKHYDIITEYIKIHDDTTALGITMENEGIL